jgi:Peptidase M60, enhancin and enhancin-like/N-terminal domain of M60-like peptidases
MRWVWSTAIVLLVGVTQGLAQVGGAGGETGRGAVDRSRLIEGVQEIGAPGAPGSLAVFAPTATVVVIGKAGGGSEVAVVASAHLGRGRIVAFAHDGYFGDETLKVADTGKLLWNAVRWAGADKSKPRVGLIDGSELRAVVEDHGATAERTNLETNPRGFDVLVVTPFRVTPSQAKRLRAFVESGGGLLVAATGWGWQQGSKKPMAEFPGNLLLAGSGVAWTDGFAERTSPKGYRAGGAVSPYANAAHALKLSAADRKVTPEELANALESIRLTLRTLPAAESQFRVRTHQLVQDLKALDLVPTHRKPVKAKDALRRFAVGLETALAHDASPNEVRILAAAINFPGGVSSQAPRGEHTVTIDTAVPGWHSLGLYAPPGEKITITVAQKVVPLNLTVQIGCHTDQLWHLNSWERIPDVVRRFPIGTTHTLAASALGGLVYIDVPNGARSQKVVVTINGVVEAPLYQLGVTNLDEWKSKIRRRPGPWAELAARNVIFSVPSTLVRDFDDPRSVLTLWDQIVEAQDRAVSLPRRQRPERIVADAQISAGYMHSGYPIMIPIDDSIRVGLNERRLRAEGAWGLFHELGHNHQSGEWTFDGTGEVTNNVLVLYVFDKVLGLPYDCGHEAIRDRAKRAKRIHDFIAKGAPFSEWKDDPFLALMMYIQLYEGFGWKPFEDIFAEYRKIPRDERPRSDEAKRDQWLVRFSKTVGKNLGPFFEAWGVPTSATARASVANLPAWMPPE